MEKDNFKHCDYCIHPIRNLESGLKCGITGEKPSFKIKCSKIEFSEEYIYKKTNLDNELREVEKTKLPTYLIQLILVLIGLIVIINNKSLAEATNNDTYYLAIRVGIIGAGISLIARSLNELIYFREKIKVLKVNKTELQKILKLYGKE